MLILTPIFSHIVVNFLFFRYIILVQIDADNMIFTVTFPIFQTCSMSTFLVVINLFEESHKHFEESRKISCDLQPAPQPFCIILNIELDP